MAITRLAFKLNDGDNYIDLAKALSVHHRTLVRQKQIFTVMGGMIVDNVSFSNDLPNDAKITVSTAPNTWYNRAAINRVFKAWKDMRSKTLANAEDSSGTGKFADFKLLMNGGSVNSYIEAIATGTSGARPVLASREWTYSTLEDEAGNSAKVQILGAHSSGRYSATLGWVSTRAVPETANEPTMPDIDGNGVLDYREDLINLLHDSQDGQGERLQLTYEENDDSPYHLSDLYADIDNPHNSQLQCLTYLSPTNPTQMVPGFEALCGLLHVHVETTASEPIFFIDVESRGRKF